MKKFLQAVTFFVAAVLLFAATTSAQTQQQVIVRAEIPFDFSVRGKTFPAGEYFVVRISNTTLVLRDRDSRVLTSVSYNPIQDVKLHSTPGLRFRVDGDRHILAQVWQAGSSGGFELRQPRQEPMLADNASTSTQTVSTVSSR